MPYHIYGAIPSSLCAPMCINNKHNPHQPSIHVRWWCQWWKFVSFSCQCKRIQPNGYRGKQDHQCKDQYVVIMAFYLMLKTELARKLAHVEEQVSAINITCMHLMPRLIQLRTGMRSARATDAHKIKGITRQLLTTPEHPIGLSHTTRADGGFHNDQMGWMLIPVEHFAAYNNDPVQWVTNTLH